MLPSKLVLVLLVGAVVGVAGCADSGGEKGTDTQTVGSNAPKVEATSTTGGIRGVVVDDRITPVKDAVIEVSGVNKTVKSDAEGLFAVSGLEEGTYFLKVTHGLYAPAQQSVEVVAGEDEPPLTKVQLIRTVFADPYFETLKYEGFIVCSANAVLPVVGGVLSEECGEGAGVPGVGRVGGQGNNNVQHDFTVGLGAKTLVVEQVWEATSETGAALYSPISTEWLCDPFCGGNTFAEIEGTSPTYAYVDNGTLEKQELTPDTIISIFTWASPATTPIGVTLNQQYANFVTVFYHLPAPEGWSFVNASPSPF